MASTDIAQQNAGKRRDSGVDWMDVNIQKWFQMDKLAYGSVMPAIAKALVREG